MTGRELYEALSECPAKARMWTMDDDGSRAVETAWAVAEFIKAECKPRSNKEYFLECDGGGGNLWLCRILDVCIMPGQEDRVYLRLDFLQELEDEA